MTIYYKVSNYLTMLLFGLLLAVTGQNVYANQDSDDSTTTESANMVMNVPGVTVDKVNLVSLEITDLPFAVALKMLAREANVGISYNSNIIPDKKVTLKMSDEPFYEALFKLLEGTNLESTLAPTRDVLLIRELEDESAKMREFLFALFFESMDVLNI